MIPIGTWFREPGLKWHYAPHGWRSSACGLAAGPGPGDDTIVARIPALTKAFCKLCLGAAAREQGWDDKESEGA